MNDERVPLTAVRSASSKSEEVSLNVNAMVAFSPFAKFELSGMPLIVGTLVSTAIVATVLPAAKEFPARSVNEAVVTLIVVVPSKSAPGVNSTV